MRVDDNLIMRSAVGWSGAFPQCDEYIVGALDRHIMDNHLELGQLRRCPVEWCAVWKGSVKGWFGPPAW